MTPCVSVEHRVPPWNLPWAGCYNVPATARLRGTPWVSVEFTLGVGYYNILATARLRGTPRDSVEFTFGIGSTACVMSTIIFFP